MHDRFIRELPDELDVEVLLEELDGDAIRVEEIQKLHQKLKRLDADNHRRKVELFEKHGIMLRGDNDLMVRVNLLVEMFVGHLSPERLQYEIRWAEAMKEAMEIGYSEYLEARRQEQQSKKLMIPGKGDHIVPAPPPKGSL